MPLGGSSYSHAHLAARGVHPRRPAPVRGWLCRRQVPRPEKDDSIAPDLSAGGPSSALPRAGSPADSGRTDGRPAAGALGMGGDPDHAATARPASGERVLTMGTTFVGLREASLLLPVLVPLLMLVRASFRWGRRQRPCPLPPALLGELSAHKRHCLGEPPERVALELELLFGSSAPVSDSRTGVSSTPVPRHGASRWRMSGR